MAMKTKVVRSSTDMNTKPYSPEEARGIVGSLKQPAVFCNMACDWPALKWSVEYLSSVLEDKPLRFRIGKRQTAKAPQFETQCCYAEATLSEFLAWTQGQPDAAIGPFSTSPYSQCWAYADYKYIAMLFEEESAMFQDVVWTDFGFPDRDGRDSTLWIGTEGANTPCHQDSYGCNLVLQVHGRKRWHLFPSEDTHCLYPTRIPYEESSVFSRVNVVNPDWNRFPAFAKARAHVVTLNPGQVLFVPRHWWHYVESIDPITVSINSWLEMDVDDEARVGEALTKTLVCALKSAPSPDNSDNWLNPTEVEATSHETNLRYLSLAVQSCLGKRKDLCNETLSVNPGAAVSSHTKRKRDTDGTTANKIGRKNHCEPPQFTFGPHLIPVPRKLDEQSASPGDKGGERCSCKHSDCSAPSNKLERHRCEKCSPSSSPERDSTNEAVLEEDKKEADTLTITTNDLLDCLLQPQVVSLVAKLLFDKQGTF
ncbi:HSPB1-associated protein 1-like protein isoform X1 [Huso huso]|uniref:HSPB1-associated protein 1-like protein isoform X1 n=1 Tax=Huso huso TaxID=61971 RepID=A0ABR0ZKE7_HUSHU